MFTVAAADGTPLGTTLYRSHGDEHSPVVLINSATGVRRKFYDPFARFLAETGLAVVTYDYRGIGDSRPKHLRGFAARMRDWGERDLTGMIGWIDEHFAGRPIVIVGHSVGGQLLGLAPNADRVRAMLSIGAQSGWFGHWPAPRRWLYSALWYVVVPSLSNTIGYFPARVLGLGEDLPRGVALEWARWCRNPNYMVDDTGSPLRPHFDRFRGTLLALSVAGDHFAPQRAVAELASWYSRATVRHEHLDSGAFGLAPLGHFGFFRDAARASLWERAARWIHDPALHRHSSFTNA